MTETTRPQLRRFIERTKEGMQRPPIFEASDEHDYVLKLDTDDRDFPAVELVAAGLAQAFLVPLPHYEVLDAPQALIDAFLATGDRDHAEFAESFQRRGGMCFGSRYLQGVTVKWAEALRGETTDADRLLVRLLVFDGFIENSDRTSATNPNLLVNNGRLFAIDHGQGLPSVQGISPTVPFAFDSHLGWDAFVRRPNLVDEPLADLTALADDAIDAAVAAVPGEWWTADGRDALVRRALRERRDRLPATLERLKERLQ